MKKIVVNASYGCFDLSDEALARFVQEAGDLKIAGDRHLLHFRDNPILVRIVEEMGSKASNFHSDLRIVEIPDEVSWEINEYDGKEWVSEKHRKWFPSGSYSSYMYSGKEPDRDIIT